MKQKGILCILASAFGFALMAACVRLCDDYGGALTCFQKSFFRNLIAVAVAAIAFAGLRDRVSAVKRLSRSDWWLLILRSTLGTLGIFANFYALSRIPIAEGQTLNKTAPFFTVALAWLFLRERVSFRQAMALLLAFGGVVMIAKPGFAGEATLPLALGLFSGFCAGSAYAVVRQLGRRQVASALIVMFFSAFSCLAAVPFMAMEFRPVNLLQVLILLGAGLGGAIGQFGITMAYRFAAPRDIAVYDYTNIVFTAIFGLVLFGQLPDGWSLVGMAVIIFAAVLCFFRKEIRL